jgi:hypothetical protein
VARCEIGATLRCNAVVGPIRYPVRPISQMVLVVPTLSYLQVAAMTPDEVRKARGDHVLQFSTAAAAAAAKELVAEFPIMVPATVLAANPRPEVPWQGMAQVVLPHVSADEDVKEALAMQAVIKDGTWIRWWNTMSGLALKHPPAAPEALGVWHRRMAAALENSSDAERKAMRLQASDLEDVEVDPVPAMGPAGASAAATVAAELHRKEEQEGARITQAHQGSRSSRRRRQARRHGVALLAHVQPHHGGRARGSIVQPERRDHRRLGAYQGERTVSPERRAGGGSRAAHSLLSARARAHRVRER